MRIFKIMTKAKLAWSPLLLAPFMFRYHRQERPEQATFRESGKKVLINKVFTHNFLVFTQFYLYAAANDWRVVKTFIGFSGIDKIYEDPVDILWELGLDIFTAKLCPSVRPGLFHREKRALSILLASISKDKINGRKNIRVCES